MKIKIFILALLLVAMTAVTARADGESILNICNQRYNGFQSAESLFCVTYMGMQTGIISAAYTDNMCQSCVSVCTDAGESYGQCMNRCQRSCGILQPDHGPARAVAELP